MNASLIARLTLARANPEYARKRLQELIESFMRDFATRPEVYRETIPDAAPQDQPLLHDMLDMIVSITQAHDQGDTQRIDELDEEYRPLIQGFDRRLQKAWTDLYFVGDVWKETDLCLTVTKGLFTDKEILS